MAKQKTQIITIVCNKGGVGRSTTAINFAWSLANKRKNVLVCDLDAQANSSSTLAKNYNRDVVENGKNITNLLKSSGDSASDYFRGWLPGRASLPQYSRRPGASSCGASRARAPGVSASELCHGIRLRDYRSRLKSQSIKTLRW